MWSTGITANPKSKCWRIAIYIQQFCCFSKPYDVILYAIIFYLNYYLIALFSKTDIWLNIIFNGFTPVQAIWMNDGDVADFAVAAPGGLRCPFSVTSQCVTTSSVYNSQYCIDVCSFTYPQIVCTCYDYMSFLYNWEIRLLTSDLVTRVYCALLCNVMHSLPSWHHMI